MSTTRSASRPAPATDGVAPRPDTAPPCAVILVAHGSPRVRSAVDDLHRHAAALARLPGIATVSVAILHGEGRRPDGAMLETGASRVVVVPMMMCDGQTSGRDLPSAFAQLPNLGQHRLYYCPPIGVHPKLVSLIAARATARAGAAASATTVLLIGHGSTQTTASHDATTRIARRLRALGRFRAVESAFLEEAPFLADLLPTLPSPVIAVGLFATAGRHATADVASALRAAGRDDISYLGAIGTDTAIVGIIHDMVRGVAWRDWKGRRDRG